MTRAPSSAVVAVRHFVLALLAIGLIFRAGTSCEAMAATFAPSVEHSACADMPIKDHKPVKAPSVECALCAALPVHAVVPSTSMPLIVMEPATGRAESLAGLISGPAPPPPRVA